MNVEKVKEFIEWSMRNSDCGFCRANGIDIRKNDCKSCTEEILKILELEE